MIRGILVAIFFFGMSVKLENEKKGKPKRLL